MNGCGCVKELDMKIKYHSLGLIRVEKISIGDWIDLRTVEDVEMKVGDFKLISLGISVEVPKGYEMWLVPRSSTFKNFGIIQTNGIGIIDESYCGDGDIIKMAALAMRDTKISTDSRICQFRLMPKQLPINFITVDTLGNEDRGGFGSTGVK
jgi:dUTP pyrophosphatase